MRILCVSAQLPGHLDWGGYLATAAELAQRGHEVIWASGSEVAAAVARAGVAFAPLAATGWRWPPPPPLMPAPGTDPHAVQQQKQLRALDQWLETARVAAAVDALTALAADFCPDLLLTEMFVAAAGLVAERLACPLAVMGWPAPIAQPVTGADGMALVARARLDELLARFALRGENFTPSGPPALCAPRLHVTYWSPGWFAGLPSAPQTVHVGGLRPAFAPPLSLPPLSLLPGLPAPEDAPWVLITLGTSFNVDANFFITAAHAAEQLGCLPLLAVGAPLDARWVQALRPRLPRTARVLERVDFAQTLPQVAAAIHHGGAGTTHALVVHAVPQIVVPHAADQVRQAQGVLRSGVGAHLPPAQMTLTRTVEALAQALPDRSPLRVQARLLQAEFDALGGVPAAADMVEQLML
jgi:UDP:flavonoid glycosyltransferase YjiC (YdhE family)